MVKMLIEIKSLTGNIANFELENFLELVKRQYARGLTEGGSRSPNNSSRVEWHVEPE